MNSAYSCTLLIFIYIHTVHCCANSSRGSLRQGKTFSGSEVGKEAIVFIQNRGEKEGVHALYVNVNARLPFSFLKGPWYHTICCLHQPKYTRAVQANNEEHESSHRLYCRILLPQESFHLGKHIHVTKKINFQLYE